MNIHLPAILMFTRGTRVLTHPHNGINNTFPGDDTVLSPCCSCCGVWYHPQAGRDENRRVIPELYDVLQRWDSPLVFHKNQQDIHGLYRNFLKDGPTKMFLQLTKKYNRKKYNQHKSPSIHKGWTFLHLYGSTSACGTVAFWNATSTKKKWSENVAKSLMIVDGSYICWFFWMSMNVYDVYECLWIIWTFMNVQLFFNNGW